MTTKNPNIKSGTPRNCDLLSAHRLDHPVQSPRSTCSCLALCRLYRACTSKSSTKVFEYCV